MLYLPTSDAIKFKAKGWIDVFGSRCAKGVGSFVTLSSRGDQRRLATYGGVASFLIRSAHCITYHALFCVAGLARPPPTSLLTITSCGQGYLPTCAFLYVAVFYVCYCFARASPKNVHVSAATNCTLAAASGSLLGPSFAISTRFGHKIRTALHAET